MDANEAMELISRSIDADHLNNRDNMTINSQNDSIINESANTKNNFQK